MRGPALREGLRGYCSRVRRSSNQPQGTVSGFRHYTKSMYRHPHPVVARMIAIVAAVMVASSGGGLPMCLSLVADGAAPCPMHSERNPGLQQSAQASVQNVGASSHSCHSGAEASACGAAGTCSAGGPAALALIIPPIQTQGPQGTVRSGAPTTYPSHFITPPSPPPQA